MEMLDQEVVKGEAEHYGSLKEALNDALEEYRSTGDTVSATTKLTNQLLAEATQVDFWGEVLQPYQHLVPILEEWKEENVKKDEAARAVLALIRALHAVVQERGITEMTGNLLERADHIKKIFEHVYSNKNTELEQTTNQIKANLRKAIVKHRLNWEVKKMLRKVRKG